MRSLVRGRARLAARGRVQCAGRDTPQGVSPARRLASSPGLSQHRHGSLDAFDETRAGLDHLAFTVADRGELDAWAARLADAAVVHSPITAANSVPGAAVLVFRDPDNIQLELFAEPPS